MEPSTAGRSGRPWREMRKRVLREYGAICWQCWYPIDLTLPKRHPRSYSVDHKVPRSKGGSSSDIRNLRPAHLGCNSSKGARAAVRPGYARAGGTPAPARRGGRGGGNPPGPAHTTAQW